jgi:hypothetical protein
MANWVKYTHKGDENPVYVDVDSGMSIRWIESDKATIITLPSGENDIVRVLERPEVILKVLNAFIASSRVAAYRNHALFSERAR